MRESQPVGITITPTNGPAISPRKRQQYWIVGGSLAALAIVVIVAWSVTMGPYWLAHRNYKPQEGDLVFQSLQVTPVVAAIEGATGSSFSHCGIVARDSQNRWVVYEALHHVEQTPLEEFLFRGRNFGFAIYRLRPEKQSHVPAMLQYVRQQMGKPYDEHYDWDDEAMYCSELIYKGYEAAAPGEPLGKMVLLDELEWKPYEDLIRRKEGDIPKFRSIITPRNLALAERLELVARHEIELP